MKLIKPIDSNDVIFDLWDAVENKLDIREDFRTFDYFEYFENGKFRIISDYKDVFDTMNRTISYYRVVFEEMEENGKWNQQLHDAYEELDKAIFDLEEEEERIWELELRDNYEYDEYDHWDDYGKERYYEKKYGV